MDLPTLRQLEYLIAIEEHGTFHAAARACHVSQPALSKQVQQVEQLLGVTLFERARPQAIPTEPGRVILARARQILLQARELVHDAHAWGDRAWRGPLHLGVIPTIAPYLLPGFLLRARQRWPELTIITHELHTQPLLAALRQGQLELALLATPIDEAQLMGQDVLSEPFLLAAPQAHPLGQGGPVQVHELRDAPLILMDEGHCFRDHALEVCAMGGARAQTQLRAGSVSTLLQLVDSGLGATLIPAAALMREAASTRGVVYRRFAPPAPSRTIGLRWRASSARSGQLLELAALLRAHCDTLLL